MRNTVSLVLICFVAAAGCRRDTWPSAPAVDETKYHQEYTELTKD